MVYLQDIKRSLVLEDHLSPESLGIVPVTYAAAEQGLLELTRATVESTTVILKDSSLTEISSLRGHVMTVEALCNGLQVIHSQELEDCIYQEQERLRTLVLTDFENRCDSFDQLLALQPEDARRKLEQLRIISQQYDGVAEWTKAVASQYGSAVEKLTVFLYGICGRLESLLKALCCDTVDASVTDDLIDTMEVLSSCTWFDAHATDPFVEKRLTKTKSECEALAHKIRADLSRCLKYMTTTMDSILQGHRESDRTPGKGGGDAGSEGGQSGKGGAGKGTYGKGKGHAGGKGPPGKGEGRKGSTGKGDRGGKGGGGKGAALFSDHESMCQTLKSALKKLEQLWPALSRFYPEMFPRDAILEEVYNAAARIGEAELHFMPSLARGSTVALQNCIDSKGVVTLNNVLEFMTHLGGIDERVDETIFTLKSTITQALELCGADIVTTIKRPACYNEKLDCLKLMTRLHPHTFVTKLLPHTLECLQEMARVQFSVEAKELEDFIYSSADTELIDAKIRALAESLVIDDYIQKAASNEIANLHRLKESRQEGVDEKVVEKINKLDFAGIGEYLQPLQGSSDQGKREKLQKYMSMISESLHTKSAELLARVQFGHEAVLGMRTLEDADNEVGDLLQMCDYSMKLTPMIDRMRSAIHNHMHKLLSKLENAIDLVDYVDMDTQKQCVEAYYEQTKTYISNRFTKRFNELLDEATASAQRLPSLVKNFLNIDSQKVKSDNTKLLHALDSLNKAPESQNDLKDLYADTVRSLEVGLHELHMTTRDAIKHHAYADAIDALSHVQNEMFKGLGKHVNLNFDPAKCVSDWTKQQKDHDEDMQKRFRDYDDIKCLVTLLNDLANPTWGRKFMGWFSRESDGRQYRNEVNNVEREVMRLQQRAKQALTDGSYSVVKQCIQKLERIDSELSRHIKSTETCLRHLREDIPHKFIGLCDSIQKALDNNNLSEFESQFRRYQSYVLNLLALSPKNNEKFHITNQRIVAFATAEVQIFESRLKTFDFTHVRLSINKLRAFGKFLTGDFAFFYEQVKFSIDVKPDKFLDELNSLCHQRFCNGRMGMMRDLALLGVRPGADLAAVTKAYKAKCRQYHPDKNKGTDTTELFKAISNAHDKIRKELEVNAPTTKALPEPFQAELQRIPHQLRKAVQNYLSEARYDLIAPILFNLADLSVLKDFMPPETNCAKINREVLALVKQHVDKTFIKVDSNWAEKKLKALNDSFNDLISMEQHFSAYSAIYTESWSKKMVTTIEKEISNLAQQAHELLRGDEAAVLQSMGDFRCHLLSLGRIMDELPLLCNYANMKMQNLFEFCLSECSWGYLFIYKLGISLQNMESGTVTADDERIGRVIVSEFSCFKDVNTMVWNEEVSQKPAEETVQLVRSEFMKGDRVEELIIDKDTLLSLFEAYEAQYEDYLSTYLNPHSDLQDLVATVMTTTNQLRPCDLGNWTPEVKETIPIILAGIFAHFTVSKSGDSFNRLTDDEGQAGNMNVLLKPHNIQVMAILRLLGCDSNEDSLASHLMQIRTGEGKSILLGATAALLALLGFRVCCVCYSEYLSERDFELFRGIFDSFGVSDRIRYSKITELSEHTANSKGDIRQMTQQLIKGTLPPAPHTPLTSVVPANVSHSSIHPVVSSPGPSAVDQEILLVDEVDVFFGKDFYGQTYKQVTSLQASEIQEIIGMVFKGRGTRQTLRSVQVTAAYQTLLRQYPTWQFLIDNEIKLMLAQVDTFDEPPYHVDRSKDRIGYKILDTVDYDVSYRYRTAFAYLHENNRRSFRNGQAALDRALKLMISCGEFSYANISPARILGVSGTVQAMTDYEKEVMNRYGVQMFTYIPSVYGSSNFQFDEAGDGICIEANLSDYFHSIVDKVNAMAREKRATIVFFPDTARLDEFRRSAFYGRIHRKSLLTEDLDKEDKDYVIKKAATVAQTTLSTAVFGRGTDFVCMDKSLLKNGGVHVIQAFLSAEKSEEIQIQGRTARQGKKGSYQMVLLESDLEAFAIKQGSDHGEGDLEVFGGGETGQLKCVAKSDRWTWLEDLRQAYLAEHYMMIDENLAIAAQRDTLTHQYLDALLANDLEVAYAKFREMYEVVKMQHTGGQQDFHVIFCLDESGSMSWHWNALLKSYTSYLDKRVSDHAVSDLVSVITFGSGARLRIDREPITTVPREFDIGGGGTKFGPPLKQALDSMQATPSSMTPLLVFMSDGACDDKAEALTSCDQICSSFGTSVQVHCIGFGAFAPIMLNEMAHRMGGEHHAAADGCQLEEVFTQIASALVAEYGGK